MAEYSAFDVLGPIMVGPSSSHTAGACRIAHTAADICGFGFKKVSFHLHGSFGHTYKGHFTDKALVGGALGYNPDDERIKNAFQIAKENGLEYEFIVEDLGDKYHPNTVKVVFHYDDKEEYVIGTSIGGGAVVIVNINGIDITFKGSFSTILLQYPEQQGVLSFVSSELANNNYNIESINTSKNHLTDVVTLTVEIDKPLTEELKKIILEDGRFITAKYVEVI